METLGLELPHGYELHDVSGRLLAVVVFYPDVVTVELFHQGEVCVAHPDAGGRQDNSSRSVSQSVSQSAKVVNQSRKPIIQSVKAVNQSVKAVNQSRQSAGQRVQTVCRSGRQPAKQYAVCPRLRLETCLTHAINNTINRIKQHNSCDNPNDNSHDITHTIAQTAQLT